MAIIYLEAGDTKKAQNICDKAHRLLSKNKEKHHDIRGIIIGELIKIISGRGDQKKLNSIDEFLDFECNWLLSQCYCLLGHDDQADKYREIARETLMEESHHISNPDQWKYFLEQNVLNRRIINKDQIFALA